MLRYILSFEGTAEPPPNDLNEIRARVSVVDASRRSLLVEVDQPEQLADLMKQLIHWKAQPEIKYPLPTTRPRLKRKP